MPILGLLSPRADQVWEYRVAAGREPEFCEAYAADGVWASLFALGDGLVSTKLFAAVGGPDRYLTVDRFESSRAWDRFLAEHGDAHRALGCRLAALTVENREVVTLER